MKLFKNKVGRPSNETIKKRRLFYIGIVVVLVAVMTLSGFLVISKSNSNLSSGSKKIDTRYNRPIMRFNSYSNCRFVAGGNFTETIYNGVGSRGKYGIQTPYWTGKFTLELEVSSNSSIRKGLRNSDIVVGKNIALYSVKLISNKKKNGLYVSKYRITLKSKVAVSIKGVMTNIQIKKNSFINVKGYGSTKHKIPIFLAPYE